VKRVRFWDEPLGVKSKDGRMLWVVSNEFLAIGLESNGPAKRFLPAWVEFDLFGLDEPDLHLRMEVRDGVPRVAELSWRARENQSEIRQKQLREVGVNEVANLVYGPWVSELRDDGSFVILPTPSAEYAVDPVEGKAFLMAGGEQYRAIRGSLDDLRAGRRHINTELLRQVAEVYRANFDNGPAQAVARTFGVKPRMAHEYVRRARDRGFLPMTSQGKKKI